MSFYKIMTSAVGVNRRVEFRAAASADFQPPLEAEMNYSALQECDEDVRFFVINNRPLVATIDF